MTFHPKIMPWVAFALALALTWALTPLVQKLAVRFGAVAVPRERDVHKKPLPRWGGLAMVGAFLVTLGLVYLYIAATGPSSPGRTSSWSNSRASCGGAAGGRRRGAGRQVRGFGHLAVAGAGGGGRRAGVVWGAD